MAVEAGSEHTTPAGSAARRFFVGTNVIIATVLVVGIVVILQALAYKNPVRWDMTSSGVNSLSKATENLLRGLDTKVELTSLYFETDREEPDQQRYRQAADDLLRLYEATNRSKVSAAWINPLKDHEQFNKLRARLRELPAFKEQIDKYAGAIEHYEKDLYPQMQALVQSELEAIGGLGVDITGAGPNPAIAQVEQAFTKTQAMLEQTHDQIESLNAPDAPQYSLVVDQIRTFYNNFKQTLGNIGKFGKDQAARASGLKPEQVAYLSEAEGRFADLVSAIDAETKKLQKLEPLKYEDVIRQLEPTANAILVETDNDATVVDFPSVWPPMDQRAGSRAGFEDRAFKGEEKLTSAILRATHKKQTAIVFVRYGGPPMFMGGFMPGQPAAPYARMKEQLEEANFDVEEWDVKTADTPPTIDPKPTRTLYVVFQPTPPQRQMMGQPSNDPPFSDAQRQKVLDAIGKDGRAMFIVGWHPGQFGMIPANYEYADYLKNEWGIEVDTSALLIQTTNTAPGKYQVTRRDFYNMDDVEVTDFPIVAGPLSRELALPACAPLKLPDTPPDGVTYHRLVYIPDRDNVWGVKNLQVYEEQLRQKEYLSRVPTDLAAPFDLAVAATKGDAKIVVVSSADFAVDDVAFMQAMSIGPHGLTIRSRNPGNVSLMINSMHWLNGNDEFMNIGEPIEAAVLKIGSTATVRKVQALTIFAWPMVALLFGAVVWLVRRR